LPAPFVGTVTLQVTEGSPVTAGQVIATIEAMKMEAAITAPLDGTVARLAINPVQPVEGGTSSSLSAERPVKSLEPVASAAPAGASRCGYPLALLLARPRRQVTAIRIRRC